MQRAAYAGSADMVQAILKALGPDDAKIACQQPDPHKYTLLQRAAYAGSADMVQAILKALGPNDAKAACQQPDPNGCTPLHLAARAGSAAAVKAILEALGPDDAKIACQQTDPSGCSPLHEAASSGDLSTIQMILGTLSDQEAMLACQQPDHRGRTPLHLAAIAYESDSRPSLAVVQVILLALEDQAMKICQGPVGDGKQVPFLEAVATVEILEEILKHLGSTEKLTAISKSTLKSFASTLTPASYERNPRTMQLLEKVISSADLHPLFAIWWTAQAAMLNAAAAPSPAAAAP